MVWLQITGGEPTIDKHFTDAYRLAFELGTMVTVSTNGSRLWRRDLLELFTTLPPYRLVVSLYGATETAYDGLTQRRGSYKAFRRGIAAAIEAALPVRLNIVVTDVSADETSAMAALAGDWGVPHNVYTNMTPTIYGGGVRPWPVSIVEHGTGRAARPDRERGRSPTSATSPQSSTTRSAPGRRSSLRTSRPRPRHSTGSL